MAEEKLNIVIETEGSAEAVDQLKEVNEAVEQNTEAITENATAVTSAGTATGGFTAKLGSMFQGLESGISKLNAALGVIGFFITAIQTVVGWIDEYKKKQEELTVATNEYRGDLEAAKNSIGDFVSELDIMRSRTIAARDGLALTEQGFIDLTIVAQNFANQTGREVTDVIGEISSAIMTKNIPALRAMGLQVTENMSRMELMAELERKNALESARIREREALENQNFWARFFGDAETMVRATQRLRQLDRERNAREQEAARETEREASRRARMLDLRDESQETLSSLNQLVARKAQIQTAEWQRQAQQIFAQMTLQRGLMLAQGDTTNAALLEQAIAGFQERFQFQADGSVIEAPQPRQSGGGGAPRTFERTQTFEQLDEQELELANLVKIKTEEEERIALAQQLLTIQQDQANIQKEYEASVARETAVRAQQLEQEREMMAFRVREAENDQRLRDEAAAQRDENMAKVEEGFKQTSMFAVNAAKVAIKAEGDKKKAVKLFLKDWLKGFAQQMGMKAIEKTAEGIGELPSPTAAFKFASAAAYAALAAAAGGGAKAINTGGGGGKQTAKQEASKVPGSAPSGDGGGGRPALTINMNMQPYSTDIDVGMAIKKATGAADNRYG